MTPGTRESASSRPNPLTDRSSEAEIFVMASGTLRIAAGDRVTATVTLGSAWAESRGVWRCAIASDVARDASSRQYRKEGRMNLAARGAGMTKPVRIGTGLWRDGTGRTSDATRLDSAQGASRCKELVRPVR